VLISYLVPYVPSIAASPLRYLWVVVSPTMGGLIAGAALTWLVPGARGSGIPQVKQAFATSGGRVRLRDAVGKFCLSSLQIGSGASLGREGPTVQICAGVASSLARATALPPRNFRRVMPVGVAAGIAAAFNAPIAAVTFTIEEVVGTLDSSILSGVVVAAAIAAVVERGILGAHPIFALTRVYGLENYSSLLLFAALGVAAAFVSVAFTQALLRLRAAFRTLKSLPSWMHPAVGGLITGALAAVALAYLGTTGVTGGGYFTLGRALNGDLGFRVLAALCVMKLLATAFSYGSGGAGGIFAPSLFIGAMLGGGIGHLDQVLLHHDAGQLGAFALVGMGAVFAGVIRAPITSVLIIFEMTGGYGLVLPLMLANMVSYAIARHLQPAPIYEALLEQDGIHLPSPQLTTAAFEKLHVVDAMSRTPPMLHALATVGEARRLVPAEAEAVALVDDAGHPVGEVTAATLAEVALADDVAVSSVSEQIRLVSETLPLVSAIVQLADAPSRRLWVVSSDPAERLVGSLAMRDIGQSHRETVPYRRRDAGAELALAGGSWKKLIRETVVVAPDTPVPELLDQVNNRGAKAFVFQGPDGFQVLLYQEIVDFTREQDVGGLLRVSDLSRPAPAVLEGAGFDELLPHFRSDAVSAVVALSGPGGSVRGVVTRNAVGRALLARALRPQLG
jgi:CIC family chloride channel protein